MKLIIYNWLQFYVYWWFWPSVCWSILPSILLWLTSLAKQVFSEVVVSWWNLTQMTIAHLFENLCKIDMVTLLSIYDLSFQLSLKVFGQASLKWSWWPSIIKFHANEHIDWKLRLWPICLLGYPWTQFLVQLRKNMCCFPSVFQVNLRSRISN